MGHDQRAARGIVAEGQAVFVDPLDQGEACVNLFQSADDASLTDVEREHGYVKPLPDQRVVSCARVHVPCPGKYTAMFSTDDAAIFGEELVADPKNFAFFSRFMVHRDFRKLRLADALYAAVRKPQPHPSAPRLSLK